jgi:hypothetical protein
MPVMGLCRLNTGCHVDRKQVTSTQIRVSATSTRFDSVCKPFRSLWASAKRLRQRRFACANLPITHLTDQARLFPIAGWPGELPPEAPTDPYVTLSRHTDPVIQPLPYLRFASG